MCVWSASEFAENYVAFERVTGLETMPLSMLLHLYTLTLLHVARSSTLCLSLQQQLPTSLALANELMPELSSRY